MRNHFIAVVAGDPLHASVRHAECVCDTIIIPFGLHHRDELTDFTCSQGRIDICHGGRKLEAES
jgi:hypothetical protein